MPIQAKHMANVNKLENNIKLAKYCKEDTIAQFSNNSNRPCNFIFKQSNMTFKRKFVVNSYSQVHTWPILINE